MGRISSALAMQAVGRFAWLFVGAMAMPAAAQEPSLPAPAVATLADDVSVEDAAQPPVEPIDLSTWSGRTDVYPFSAVILESLFGTPDPDTWRPLPLSTFFSEGWHEPWVPSPNGSGGAPRQGWINAADGNIYRLWFFTFAQGFNQVPKGNAYLGSFTLFAPLNRRLDLIINIPFILRNSAVSGLPIIDPNNPLARTRTSKSYSGFGDISFTPRFLLHETKDFTLTSELAISTPTGTQPLAGKTTVLTPAVAFWTNFPGRWVLRGGLGVAVPTNGSGTSLISQLAIGQTLTDHDVPLVGDFTYYLSTVVNTPLNDGGQTSVTLTPGLRTHVGRDWYFLAGLPTPVTNARVAEIGMIFWFMKAW
jgi:hypothetical protein